MKVFLCACFFFWAGASAEAAEMEWTSEAKNAYSLITDLRVDEALTIIRLQSISSPGNLIWPYLEDYGDFVRIFVQEDLRKMPAFLSASLLRQEKIVAVPESNPLSLMAQAQMSLHQCALHLQQGQFVSAAADINKAFKLLRKNQKLHPGDAANMRLYASLKVAFGAVPDQYRWLISMVTSLSGTIEEGLGELYEILKTSSPSNNLYYKETVLFTALAEGRLNNHPDKALQLVYTHLGKTPENKMIQYLMVNLLIASSDNDGAITTLTREVGVPGSTPIPFLDFMLGECKLFRGDADAAVYFKKFLTSHKGKHFIKEAHQKLAWHALLNGDRPGYFNHMQQILIKGASTTDEDQQAMLEAETHATPHPILLRSRLYYDGGYYEKSLGELSESLYGTLNQHGHRLEYLYRKGRILQAQKAYAEALHYLMLTISTGQYEKYYYACSAALNCGLIHETIGSNPTARKFYLMCLDMTPETYSTSLHQKARIGLNRIGE
jgi:tetratricopeptide (TPR) repeat protein